MEVPPDCSAGNAKDKSSLLLFQVFKIHETEQFYLLREKSDGKSLIIRTTLGGVAP